MALPWFLPGLRPAPPGPRRYGISPNTVAGEPEPPRIRMPPTMIQPPDGGISPSPARFSRWMRCSRSSSRLAPNDVSAPGSIPNARDPERADGALLDQPAHDRWAEPRIVQPARGIRVQVGRRVVPAVLEARPHDDGAVRRDRPEFRLPALDPGDAEGEVRVLLHLRPHVEHDPGVEEVAGIEFVRGGLVRGEVRGRGPVRARLLAGHQGLQVVAVPLDRGGRADLDRRVTGEGGAADRDHMAEEDNSGEAERGGTGPLRCAHAASNQGAGSW